MTSESPVAPNESSDVLFASADVPWLAQLRDRGFAVVEGVLDAAAAAAYVGEFWDWLEALGTGLRRADPATWAARDAWPFASRGIIEYPCVAQAPFVWRLRAEPAVVKVFERLWGERDLRCSLDRANASRPYAAARARAEPAGWFHIDQPPRLDANAAPTCVQGLVNLVRSDEHDGGLVVLPGSHRAHARYLRECPGARAGEFQIQTAEQLAWWRTNGFAPLKVCAPAGALVLWDSRTFHCNRQPDSRQLEPRFRMCVYVCMQPAAAVGEQARKRRLAALAENRAANHEPAVSRLFAKRPRLWGERDKRRLEALRQPPARRARDLAPAERRLLDGGAPELEEKAETTQKTEESR